MGDSKHIAIKGKGTISIPTCHGTKLITTVLYVSDIDHNLLSVGQQAEKGYKVPFNNDYCLIKDANDSNLFRIMMKGKNFVVNPLEEEQIAFPVTRVENESEENKLLRACSDEATLVDKKISVEVACLAKTDLAMDRSPKSVMSNDIKQAANDDPLVDTNSSKKLAFGTDQSKSSEEYVQIDDVIPRRFGHSRSNLISNILCRYYAQGFCGRGENCHFTHVQRKICRFS